MTAMGRLVSVTRTSRCPSPPSVWVKPSKPSPEARTIACDHAEGQVRPHDVDDQIEHRRVVDEVDEGLVVGEQVAPVHEGLGVLVGALLDPGIVTERKHIELRLVARLLADLVDLGGEEGHLVR